MRRIALGWFLPTNGETLDYGEPWQIPQSNEMFSRVMIAAENAGFEYILRPVASTCWDAWTSSAFMVQQTKSIKMLVAARPSYIDPVLLAKMIVIFWLKRIPDAWTRSDLLISRL